MSYHRLIDLVGRADMAAGAPIVVDHRTVAGNRQKATAVPKHTGHVGIVMAGERNHRVVPSRSASIRENPSEVVREPDTRRCAVARIELASG